MYSTTLLESINFFIFFLKKSGKHAQCGSLIKDVRHLTAAFVQQVVDIMRVNVDKVLERDQKLSELDDRADALQAGASQFESSAAKLKNKYWWKNCKVGVSVSRHMRFTQRRPSSVWDSGIMS